VPNVFAVALQLWEEQEALAREALPALALALEGVVDGTAVEGTVVASMHCMLPSRCHHVYDGAGGSGGLVVLRARA
jgi:hypothetical protein